MICQRCQDKEAKVHVTKIINNQKKEVYLCEDCAQMSGELDFAFDFSFDNLLTGLLNNKFSPQHISLINNDLKCESCGLTYKEFTHNGRLGCNQCYGQFEDRIDKLLRKIHSSTNHTGKVPRRVGKKVRLKREIEKLRTEMDKVVKNEEFEKAAEIRDKIKEIESRF